MTVYKPCTNCARDKSACEIRSRVQKSISGCHVSSINFKCGDRLPMFSAGERVYFRWRVYDDHEFGSTEINCLFGGTVVHEAQPKFIVRVDAGRSMPDENGETIDASEAFKNDSLIIKVRPSDMRRAEEPARKMCPTCCAYEGEKERCQSWEEYAPNGCLHPFSDREASAA